MKLAVVAILLVLLAFFAWQIRSFSVSGRAAAVQYDDFKAQLGKAEADHRDLQNDLNYYLNPVNLEKEVRTRFNYRKPGEKLIIIVPAAPSSTATSSSR
jgi:hypothetical protein